jgi:hypothetical protein
MTSMSSPYPNRIAALSYFPSPRMSLLKRAP